MTAGTIDLPARDPVRGAARVLATAWVVQLVALVVNQVFYLAVFELLRMTWSPAIGRVLTIEDVLVTLTLAGGAITACTGLSRIAAARPDVAGIATGALVALAAGTLLDVSLTGAYTLNWQPSAELRGALDVLAFVIATASAAGLALAMLATARAGGAGVVPGAWVGAVMATLAWTLLVHGWRMVLHQAVPPARAFPVAWKLLGLAVVLARYGLLLAAARRVAGSAEEFAGAGGMVVGPGGVMVPGDERVRALAVRQMVTGAILLVVGLAVTVGSIAMATSEGGGRYVVAWGAVVFGALRLYRGWARYRGAATEL